MLFFFGNHNDSMNYRNNRDINHLGLAKNIWLVVSNMAFIFHFIYGLSSFPLIFIFFKMGKTTNQIFIELDDGKILTGKPDQFDGKNHGFL